MIWECGRCKAKTEVELEKKTQMLLCKECRKSINKSAKRKDPANHKICPKCCKPKFLESRSPEGELICITCYRNDPANFEICSKCNHNGPVASRTPDGKSICPTCHNEMRRQDPSKFEPCTKCGHNRFVARRIDDKPFCRRCINKIDGADKPSNYLQCSESGCENKVSKLAVARSKDKKILCPKHRKKESRKSPFRRKICSCCNKPKFIERRTEDGKPICDPCAKKDTSKFEPCTKCGHNRFVARRINGKPFCIQCDNAMRRNDPSKHEKCCRCGKKRTVQARTENNKPLCPSCYKTLHEQDPSFWEKCSKCGKNKAVASRTKEGAPICKKCHKKNKVGICKKCGKEKPIKARGLCNHCYTEEWEAKQAALDAEFESAA